MKRDEHLFFFFLDDFHQGAMNHVLHFTGFTMLGYGLGRPDLVAILISPLVMESGHVWNYLRGTHHEHALRISPLQLIAWFVFVSIGFVIAKLVFGS